jgi:predicted transcriptional regulator YdeE
MENPQLITNGPLFLAGLSFFGDPFAYQMEWQTENEIGQLWNRYYAVLSTYPAFKSLTQQAGSFYEVHLMHPESRDNGKYEVFIGTEIKDFEQVPLHYVIKHLPASAYFQFTVSGEAIIEDYSKLHLDEQISALGYQRDSDLHLLVYDERFLGMDRLSESSITILIPVSKL